MSSRDPDWSCSAVSCHSHLSRHHPSHIALRDPFLEFIITIVFTMGSEVPENSQQQAPAPNDADIMLKAEPGAAEALAQMEFKMPTRKDTSLREFLHKIDDFAPIVSALCRLLSGHDTNALPPRSPTPSPATT